MANPIPPDLRVPDMTLPALAPPATRNGHVDLKVADLDRAIAFY